jgi:putative transposase
MRRQQSRRVSQREERLLPRIQALKAEPPFRGYRRIWASLRCVEQRPVNKKRLWRLMRAQHLLVPPTLRLKAKRTPMRSKPKPMKPTAWWGIDMTKVPVEGGGWVSIVIVLAWYTKAVGGHDAGLRCTAQPWLEARDMAVTRQCPQGARGQGVSLMSDTGCQPTATRFMPACATVEIHQPFTSDNNPKGNADTERFMRTLKEECLWLQEGACPFALVRALDKWINDDNTRYLHAALGDKTPRQFERAYDISHSTPFVAA